MTTGDVHVGDVGTHYRAKIQDAGAPFDPTRATVAKLLFKPPKVAQIERPATITTDGVDWFLNYHLQEGIDDTFHSKPGLWRWQGFVDFPDGQRYYTNVDTYMVTANVNSHPPGLSAVVPYGVSWAEEFQGLGVTIWYDRPLQRVGATALTVTVRSSDQSRTGDKTLLYNAAFSHLNTEAATGRAQVVYILAPLDLTGLAGVTFAVNDTCRRVGWSQLRDLETGQKVPDTLFPFDERLVVVPSVIIGGPIVVRPPWTV